MVDRNTKLLLLMLVIGVWGVLLQTAFTTLPLRSTTGGSGSIGAPGMVVTPRGVYLHHQSGTVYLLDPDLKLKARAVPETDAEGRPTIVTTLNR
jgi:hypothetical protein